MSKSGQEFIRQGEAGVSERYTKDLEDILRQLVQQLASNCPYCGPGDTHFVDCLIGQAKALLASTGYTNDF